VSSGKRKPKTEREEKRREGEEVEVPDFLLLLQEKVKLARIAVETNEISSKLRGKLTADLGEN
jgi:hypothetical protein